MPTTNAIFREIVIKRLESMPGSIRVSMGSLGTFSKDELVQNVKEGTPTGDLILQMQIKYMKSMSRGFSNE